MTLTDDLATADQRKKSSSVQTLKEPKWSAHGLLRWIGFFIGTLAGLMVIGIAAPPAMKSPS